MEDGPKVLKSIRSKIGLKIGLLVVIQIVFVICSFSILSYYESQGTHLGNSINIAGKNRFLTSNLLRFMTSDSEVCFNASTWDGYCECDHALDIAVRILAQLYPSVISTILFKSTSSLIGLPLVWICRIFSPCNLSGIGIWSYQSDQVLVRRSLSYLPVPFSHH